jgi:hypothetical protein
MRTMEDPDLPERHHSDPAALAVADFSPKLTAERLNITPLDIGMDRMRKEGLQGSAVLSSQRENGTNGSTSRYYWQAARLSAHYLPFKGLTTEDMKFSPHNRPRDTLGKIYLTSSVSDIDRQFSASYHKVCLSTSSV